MCVCVCFEVGAIFFPELVDILLCLGSCKTA